MWHIAHNGRNVAPSSVWCYSFEDFIGKIQSVGFACTAGTSMRAVGMKIMQNYRQALSIRLLRGRSW
eukprot:4403467-Alexandrium_andersonii.AAC.1